MKNQRVIQIEFNQPIKDVKFLPLKLCIIAYYAVKSIVSVHSYESSKLKGFKFTVRKNKIIKVKEL
jgi:hypothetical protein